VGFFLVFRTSLYKNRWQNLKKKRKEEKRFFSIIIPNRLRQKLFLFYIDMWYIIFVLNASHVKHARAGPYFFKLLRRYFNMNLISRNLFTVMCDEWVFAYIIYRYLKKNWIDIKCDLLQCELSNLRLPFSKHDRFYILAQLNLAKQAWFRSLAHVDVKLGGKSKARRNPLLIIRIKTWSQKND
jgi:hypothetical protein